MKKIIAIIIIFFITNLLLGCSNKKMERLPVDATILAFGDSLTFGYGAPQTDSYPVKLSQEIQRKVINAGVNGDTTEDGLNRIEQALNEHNPKLIIIGLGGNDMLRGVNPDTIKNNLKRLIEISQKQGVRVILLAEPQPNGLALIAGLSDSNIYEEVAKETDTLLISKVYSKWLSKQEYKSDLIHLNAKGYEKVAKDIAEFLKDKGAI